MRLSLTLGIHDLDRTFAFYGEILHLPIERFQPGGRGLEVLLLPCGDATVIFRRTDSLESLHPAIFQNLDRHPLGIGSAIEFDTKNLDRILKDLDRHNLHPLYELEDEEFHRREIWVHDPDGYLIVLCEESNP